MFRYQYIFNCDSSYKLKTGNFDISHEKVTKVPAGVATAEMS